MSTMAVGAIELYRRYLSPLKGFRCAHAALHHRESCSQFGLKVYGRHSMSKATAMMRRRLADCRKAYQVLVATAAAMALQAGASTTEESDKPRRKKSGWDCGDPFDACHMGSLPIPDASCLDYGACDCLGGLSL